MMDGRGNGRVRPFCFGSLDAAAAESARRTRLQDRPHARRFGFAGRFGRDRPDLAAMKAQVAQRPIVESVQDAKDCTGFALNADASMDLRDANCERTSE